MTSASAAPTAEVTQKKEQAARNKATPYMNTRHPEFQGYSLQKEDTQGKKHLIGKKEVPMRKTTVLHEGKPIGYVENYIGYKEGKPITASGVVAWRRDAEQHGATSLMGAPWSGRHDSHPAAIESLIWSHHHRQKAK